MTEYTSSETKLSSSTSNQYLFSKVYIHICIYKQSLYIVTLGSFQVHLTQKELNEQFEERL